MAGSFYEIMRRLSQDPSSRISLTFVRLLMTYWASPQDQRQLAIKRHPLIVINAGASLACAKLERDLDSLAQ